jgi:aminomethyltransferase
MSSSLAERQTPLYQAHLKCGGKIVPFAGWQMPVQYQGGGIIAEHHAVRESAGLFDISHMGEFRVTGKGAGAWLNGILTNDVRKLSTGKGQYTLMLNDEGGVLDDLILYQLAEDEFYLVVNASKIEEDWDWLNNRAGNGITLENLSDETAAVALQGPRAEAVALKIFKNAKLPKRNQIQTLDWSGETILIARTGYTGEDGFEIFVPARKAENLWDEIFNQPECIPAGLGARDTLRLEACLPLNGQDLSPIITPLEAGLGKFVSFEKDERFPGRQAIENKPPERKSVAFVMAVPSPPPRSHYPVFSGGNLIGEVTSGTQSPTLEKGIGMALVKRQDTYLKPEVEIRGKRFPILIQPKPLYKRPKA